GDLPAGCSGAGGGIARAASSRSQRQCDDSAYLTGRPLARFCNIRNRFRIALSPLGRPTATDRVFSGGAISVFQPGRADLILPRRAIGRIAPGTSEPGRGNPPRGPLGTVPDEFELTNR